MYLVTKKKIEMEEKNEKANKELEEKSEQLRTAELGHLNP